MSDRGKMREAQSIAVEATNNHRPTNENQADPFITMIALVVIELRLANDLAEQRLQVEHERNKLSAESVRIQREQYELFRRTEVGE